LFREDTLRITGAALTTIGAEAAATLADNFSTNAFTSLKFDLAANASFLFSAADGNLFVLADLAANASLTAIAFLTANICVASANAFLNAGSDVADAEDGTTVIGADAAPFADTAFGDAPFADTAFGDAPFAAAAFGDAPFAAAAFGDDTFGDADAAESAEPTDDQCATHDFGDVPFGAPFEDADDVTESAEPTDGQCETHDFGNVTFDDDDADFAFGDGATGTAPLDLNPGGPGKNTGSGGGPPFAPVDLILTIILGFDFGFLLLLLDDHELFDDFRDVPFDDDDIVLDDVPLLEKFFEPDAAFDDTDGESKIIIGDDDADFAFDAVDAVPDDKLLSEDFLELDDEDFLTFLVTCFFLENKLPIHAPIPFLGDAGATAFILLEEECRDDAAELLRFNNPGPLIPAALAGFLVNAPLTFALNPLNLPVRTGACDTTPCACAKAAIPVLADGRGRGDGGEPE
jgi:hypothetical protein